MTEQTTAKEEPTITIDDVKAICALVHTDAIKTAYAAHLAALAPT